MAGLTQPLTIGIVIPVLGDAPPLAELLQRIARWQDPAVQLIVVAGDEEPATAALARRCGARYLSTRPCRGRQLDAGAQAATSDVLWFLHADAAPDKAACGAIRTAVRQGAVGGYFRFRFQGTPTHMKRLLAWGTNLRTRWGIPYGDQGLFITRAAYSLAGGYPHQPLFEEVPLVKSLRRIGRFEQLTLSIAVDPRRWERDGWVRRALHNRWLALRYALGAAPQRLAASYPRQHRSISHG